MLTVKKIFFLFFGIATMLFVVGCSTGKISEEVASKSEATLFRSQSCGCCAVYGDYITGRGLPVDVKITEQLDDIKESLGVPSSLQSCHTMQVGGYFIEGHMPSEAIEKLLTEKPDAKGIALPGMPYGTPGMPGTKKDTWMVYLVGKDGSTKEFMRI